MQEITKDKKILGIGLPRTGTYSLALALQILGFKTKHYPDKIYDINSYEACTEVRFPIYELKKYYPNSKLILTVRDKKNGFVPVLGTVIIISRIGIHFG